MSLFDDHYTPFQGFSLRRRVAVFFELGLIPASNAVRPDSTINMHGTIALCQQKRVNCVHFRLVSNNGRISNHLLFRIPSSDNSPLKKPLCRRGCPWKKTDLGYCYSDIEKSELRDRTATDRRLMQTPGSRAPFRRCATYGPVY